MRVIEPKDFTRRKSRIKHRLSKVFLIFLVVIAVSLIFAGLTLFNRKTPQNEYVAKQSTQEINSHTLAKTKTKLKLFTPNQFKDLYRSISYPNTQPFVSAPDITGDEAADSIIRKTAEKRGFTLTSYPVSPIVKTNEPLLANEEDDLLQPLALEDWRKLKKAAKDSSINLALFSGYRSAKWQRDLFLERLLAQGVTIKQIAAGQASGQVDKTLHLTAVPGYSRHHTGYTIDLKCLGSSNIFKNTPCHAWLSKNNYENAKKYGWIPSYPEGANEQGPEPEAWEYVWVGTDLLYE